MSSKSSSSSRHSSPRAMPVETIITRFKSAQQKRQLREMDRSMTKVTELLKNPLKPKIKKVPLKKDQRSRSVISIKDVEEEKRTKRTKLKDSEKVDLDEEYCPLKLKRNVVLNKVHLKPKHDLKVIAQTNKRKRSVPIKGLVLTANSELSMQSDRLSTDMSPKAKRSKPISQDMTMDEMIQIIEQSGSLNDEDLLEILTCPSPVWWEDPPDGYIEDALFTRPRSTAEMYPSIRSQLQDNLQERQRSSTPNILSRKEKAYSKQITNNVEIKKTRKVETIKNNNDNGLAIPLNKSDEKFIRKRRKLESVLGNLKNKTIKKNVPDSNITKPPEISRVNNSRDNLSNKVSVIKHLCSDEVTKDNGKTENCFSKIQLSTNNIKQASVSMVTDSESTDDERLTDISFQDDAYLDDLENMEIPMEQNTDGSPKTLMKEKESEHMNLVPVINKDDTTKVINCDFKDQLVNKCVKTESCIKGNSSSDKCKTINFKDSAIDPTYSDKESSIIEDYFEMKLFEEDDPVVNKKQNEYSKSELDPVTPLKYTNDSKQIETNLTKSVIKFKNSDNTSINVFKIESIVPKTLPPLKNSDERKSNAGSVPEHLPPLRRNPGVIHLNSESPKSNKSTISFDTSESSSSVMIQDNMDSISDTNICFINEDDDVYSTEKKMDSNDSLEDTVVSTLIKSNNVIKTNELHIRDLGQTSHVFPKNEIIKEKLTQDVDLYKDLTHINGVIVNEFKELDFQSLTITKVNDNNCCKLEERKLHALAMKKDGINCDKKEHTKTDNFNPPEHTEIGQIESDSECVTVYKIVSDDSGNEDPKNDLLNNIRKPKGTVSDLHDMLDIKEASSNYKSGESFEKQDGNRDKMIFYFKKCKNVCWKNKSSNKIEEKKLPNEQSQIWVINPEMTATGDLKQPDDIVYVVDIKENNTGSLDESKEVMVCESNEKEINNELNHNNNLINSDSTERNCITVSNTKQMRYCMKCSSIFDTPQCNYCY